MTDTVTRRRLGVCAALMMSALASCLGGRAPGSLYSAADAPNVAGQVLNGNSVIPAVSIHRLTRYSYNLTVHDLLNTALTPADAFPVDPVNDGFDNVASTLTLTPQLLGLYNTAAKSLADELTSLQPRWQQTVLAQAVGKTADPAGSPTSNWGWLVIGQFSVSLTAPQDDDATVSVQVGAQATNAATPHMTIKVDNNTVSAMNVTATMAVPTTVTAQVHVTAGKHTVTVVFDNKVTDNGTTSTTDSELAVGAITMASTTITSNPSFGKLFACNPNAGNANVQAACWQSTALDFVQRAWRRPLTDDETTSLTALWTNLTAGLDNNDAMNYMVRSALMSSNFIYLATRPAASSSGGVTLLDDYDMASRLSYFIWGSMPDAQLLQDANNGLLRTEDGVRSEVARMLGDARVVGLQGGFAAQWLQTRELDQAAPDPTVFPTWDMNLKAAFVNESLLFFNDFLSNGLPVSAMLNPNFVFANNRLAQHYNLPSPNSDTPVKMTLQSGARAGLLSQGAWLTSNSVQTRTSAVKRGRFVLQNLLCVNIPAPPAGVPPLASSGSTAPQTQRQLLTAHVADPHCAACHNLIDPPGFGLELFDGIGAARTTDSNLTIDATGTLNGQSFNGPAQMATIIESDPAFVNCVISQLYAYALNRTVVASDAAPLAQISAAAAASNNRLDEIITQIVLSPQFRWAANGAMQ